MSTTGRSPVFSVVLPTRNRSDLFAIALRSVFEQTFRDVEVVVVDDGSSEPHASRYQTLLNDAPVPCRLLRLVSTTRGHGPAYATNHGAEAAQGTYLCFLDDDDQWTDPLHLGRVAHVLASSPEPADLILANQRGFRNGTAVERTIWIEDLADRLSDRMPDAAGAYTVTAWELLACQSFCHLNTTVVRRRFHQELEGFDVGLRYEQDRDFYLRAIDRATQVKFLPDFVARHNIPDQAAGETASTAESELSKRLYQLRVFDKAVLFSKRPELRYYAMQHRIYTLEHISVAAGKAGIPQVARYYRREARVMKLMMAWRRAALLAQSTSRSPAHPSNGRPDF